MKRYDLDVACRVGAILGEGPLWDAARGKLWFVDIKSRKLYRFDPAAAALESWDAPREIGWILPTTDQGWLVGLQGALGRFNPDNGRFSVVQDIEPDLPANRLNDAGVDRSQRLWFGSMDNGETASTGRLYRLEHGRALDSGLPAVPITNGPAFSPDGQTLYHTDTARGVVYAVPLSPDGNVGVASVFAEIAPEEGYPDGTAVDSQGCVWVALFGGWGVRRYSRTGELLKFVRFPVANVTNIAFGGGDLRTVYATTARMGLNSRGAEAQTYAGDLFRFEVDVPGLPLAAANNTILPPGPADPGGADRLSSSS